MTSDNSSILLKFAKKSDVTFPPKEKSSPTCLSSALIPMSFSEAQQHTMKMCVGERFNNVDGVAHLVVEATCVVCKHNNWGPPVFVRECSVVVGYILVNAKG